jgi:diguanylate cyclase (GGDEF)-like protein
MAEKLRERLEAHEFVYAGFKVPVTCSFGVAAVAPDVSSPERLYEVADRALYMAKKNGRNRVEVYNQA